MKTVSSHTVELSDGITHSIDISNTLLRCLRQEVVLAIKDAGFPKVRVDICIPIKR